VTTRRHFLRSLLPSSIALLLVVMIYWPGLSGGFLFDDYPNIVDNAAVQPSQATFPTLLRAAYSSPSSEFKRPLASLSFAANYLSAGIDPFWFKLTNLTIHLLNGILIYLVLVRLLLLASKGYTASRIRLLATLIAIGWLILPINLTAVLYVVQRMESIANFFVLVGLLGYLIGRQRMLASRKGFTLAALSIAGGTALGLLAKETAVMLPLYAALAEWILIRGRIVRPTIGRDRRIEMFFAVILLLPLVAGCIWLLPQLISPQNWATRDFTLQSRLLSEARIVVDYVRWTILPTPNALSFYHDNFVASVSIFQPWTTAACVLILGVSIAAILGLRKQYPLVSLGIALYLGSNVLTGTLLPLELIYEHRNYFASIGLLLAIVPPLAALPTTHNPKPLLSVARQILLCVLILQWGAQTATSAFAWGDPLRLASELASRAPDSPRAQYELGRTYIIYAKNNPDSPFTALAYAPLERAATLPNSSILPEQALIFFNAHLHREIKDAWWESMLDKLRRRAIGVQDESSLAALSRCSIESQCQLPKDRMVAAFTAALSHPKPTARLLSIYADYAWNGLNDHRLGLDLMNEAVAKLPGEPQYRLTLGRMLAANGDLKSAQVQLDTLKRMNRGGQVNREVDSLSQTLASARENPLRIEIRPDTHP
jgi:protein O-mannosyl-transferase